MMENRERISGCGCYQRKTLNGCAARHVRRPTLIETSCATDKRITKLTNLFYNCRESSSSATGTNQPCFMQNKANFKKVKINSTFFVIRNCENEPRLFRQGKQTQSKPILRLGSTLLTTGRSGQVFRIGGQRFTRLRRDGRRRTDNG